MYFVLITSQVVISLLSPSLSLLLLLKLSLKLRIYCFRIVPSTLPRLPGWCMAFRIFLNFPNFGRREVGFLCKGLLRMARFNSELDCTLAAVHGLQLSKNFQFLLVTMCCFFLLLLLLLQLCSSLKNLSGIYIPTIKSGRFKRTTSWKSRTSAIMG